MGVTHERAGRLAEAAECYRNAATLRPDWPDAHANYGNLLRKLGRVADAERELARALALDPHHAKANNFLGIVFYHTDRLAEAAAAFRRALDRRPDDLEARNNLGMTLARLGDAAGAVDAMRHTVGRSTDPYAHSALLFTLHYDPRVTPRQLFDEHVAWAQRFAEPLRPRAARYVNDRSPDRRLRVGYVSADFREHTRSRFMEPVLANHDHAAFEVFCYSDVRQPDAVTARLRAAADVWRETHALDDPALAELVRGDRIDVLVELTGHMAGHRLLTFARRPAPVQVAYPGYPNTTGLSAIDYCLTDADRDPPGAESLYSERLIRLEPTSQCYEPTDVDIDVAPPPHARAGHVTFASLNKAIKVTPDVVRAWARALHLVEDSKLLILVNPGGEPRLLELFAAEGIGADRLEMFGRLSRRAYLELHGRIDVNLDPWPYNGHTTLLDGLWMGVPAIVLEGDAHVSREGAAVMRLLGLPSLVAGSPEEYWLLAARVATDLPNLRELRRTLRDRLRGSPLMDGAALTRRVEAAYRAAWRAWATTAAVAPF